MADLAETTSNIPVVSARYWNIKSRRWWHPAAVCWGLDHPIPNGTPLANYRFYIQTMWEILERCAARL